ncbi:MAG: CinA family protein [Eubacteriales bacterium]|nr:CinA family protein [Eubacteriales bacterium]
MEVEVITEKDFARLIREENITFEDIPKILIEKLKEKGMKIAAAESCTGGLISKLLTDESGVSAVFDCGVCSYANQIKQKVLGVKCETLEAFGAVSPETAMEMAQGVRSLANAQIGISATGIAGPTGGSGEKPVGTVYIGIGTEGKTEAVRGQFSARNDSRDKNRQLSAYLALYCAFRSI